MKNRITIRFTRTLRTVTASVVLLLAISTCLPLQQAAQPAQILRIAIPDLEQNALIYIAEERGYFTDNGLKVDIMAYDSGVGSLDALLQDQADLAVASEFPAVRLVIQGEDLVILASADRFENDYILARPDRGIKSAGDLRGKKIGVALGTITEFYLSRFLRLNNIPPDEVALVDLPPDRFVEAITGGEVDALIAWQPHVYNARQKMNELIDWPAQSNQAVYSVVTARRMWAEKNSDALVRFLQSLLEAESFLLYNPEQARTIIAEKLGYEEAYIEAVWPKHRFSLTLDYSLIVTMTDEARWLAENSTVSLGPLPDLLNVIVPVPLKSIKPEAVDIDR